METRPALHSVGTWINQQVTSGRVQDTKGMLQFPRSRSGWSWFIVLPYPPPPQLPAISPPPPPPNRPPSWCPPLASSGFSSARKIFSFEQTNKQNETKPTYGSWASVFWGIDRWVRWYSLMKRREDGGGGGVELGVNVLGEMTTRGHPRQHPRYNGPSSPQS